MLFELQWIYDFLENQTMKNAWNKIMDLIGVATIGMTALEVVSATVSI